MRSTTWSRARVLRGAALLSVCVLGAPAFAEGFVAVGAGVERQNVVCASGAPCEDTEAAWRLAGGWRAANGLGAELVWLQPFSAFTASDRNAVLTWTGEFDVRVLGLSGTWNFQLFGLDWQARAGAASVRGTFDSRTVGVPDSSATEIRALLGAGFRRNFDNGWTLRLDADVTDGQAFTRKGRLSLFTVGIERRF
jgi:hypothetical protein